MRYDLPNTLPTEGESEKLEGHHIPNLYPHWIHASHKKLAETQAKRSAAIPPSNLDVDVEAKRVKNRSVSAHEFANSLI